MEYFMRGFDREKIGEISEVARRYGLDESGEYFVTPAAEDEQMPQKWEGKGIVVRRNTDTYPLAIETETKLHLPYPAAADISGDPHFRVIQEVAAAVGAREIVYKDDVNFGTALIDVTAQVKKKAA